MRSAAPAAPPATEESSATSSTTRPPSTGSSAPGAEATGSSATPVTVAPAAGLDTSPTPSPPTDGSEPADIGGREVTDTGYAPYARVGDVVLHHPGGVVELIGFHQSNHEGAQPQESVDGSARAMELASRGRGSSSRSAADIVTRPGTEIRAVVTGVVDRASAYTLYCDVLDEYLVIVPDGAPDLEVKLLHVVGLRVAPGDRVVAGVTPVADGVHTLPFASQVDDETGNPSWGHVHVEVVDTRIPNVPNGNSGSDDC